MRMKTFTLPDSAMQSEEYTKFGYTYKIVTLASSELYIEFPMFCSVDKLNTFLLEIMNNCIVHKGTMKVKLTYADAQCISLTVNERIYLNYSVEDNILLSPEYALKLRGIRKRDIKAAINRAGKQLRPSLNTVRFTVGGIRIDGTKKQSSEHVTVKITPHIRKIRKFTK